MKHEKGSWLLRLDVKGKIDIIQPSFQCYNLGRCTLILEIVADGMDTHFFIFC